ncbi:sphingosine kinase 2-like isoform X1 [Tachypleus tridentatus]|uniref:sphingosine kinase 2-like isoform X1 n=1 Tax=Tachypleus tridentatus TaxID=6853 RepID=UPI003FD68099
MVVSSVLPLFERFNLSTVKSSTMLQLDENATISSTSEELTPIPHWPEEVLLEDIFCYHGSFGKRSNVVVRLTNVRLTCEFISCDKKSRVRKVYLRDVIGCKIKMNTTKDRCNLCLEIYYYPIVQIMCVKRRQRHQLSLTVKRASSWDINEKYALKWRSAILFMASRNSKFQDDMNGKKYSILDGPLPKRHILVVINPASGRQRALKIFQSQVVPMFEESEISWVVVVSARKTFTKTYIESADLSPFDGIVSVSGDGLLYEVVNGLLARPDWREAIKIPLGVIPAGSGNAIFRSMTKVQGQVFFILIDLIGRSETLNI